MSIGDRYRVIGNDTNGIHHHFGIGDEVVEVAHDDAEDGCRPGDKPVSVWVRDAIEMEQHVAPADLEAMPPEEQS